MSRHILDVFALCLTSYKLSPDENGKGTVDTVPQPCSLPLVRQLREAAIDSQRPYSLLA